MLMFADIDIHDQYYLCTVQWVIFLLLNFQKNNYQKREQRRTAWDKLDCCTSNMA